MQSEVMLFFKRELMDKQNVNGCCVENWIRNTAKVATTLPHPAYGICMITMDEWNKMEEGGASMLQ